jgi:hypothetical protein
MNIQQILQYATLFSVVVGGLGLAVAFLIHREQVKTQIFLALSARYDELMQRSSPIVWLSSSPDSIPERSHELTISTLRFCTLVSLAYFLFRQRRIPAGMWELMLRTAEHRMRTPWFLREWEELRFEFESFPEFIELVGSVRDRATGVNERFSGSESILSAGRRSGSWPG